MPEHTNDKEEKHNGSLESSDTEQTPENSSGTTIPKGSTVLVVDDELPIRRLVKRRIQRFAPNVTVVEALNGKEGLEKLEEIREKTNRDPTLIITDLNMPVMDGWDFVAELTKDYESRGYSQGVPVIVLSATGGEKGILFMRRSVVKGRNVKYSPLISVAKESCVNPDVYDATGERGLDTWLQFFLKHTM